MLKNPRWGFLLFWNALALVLLLSLFSPLTAAWWAKIDLSVFHFFNRPLSHSPNLRLFWAFANHGLADWFEDLCILTFYFVAILKTAKGKRKMRAAELIFCIVLTILTIILINRFLCRDFLRLRRKSPSHLVPDSVNISTYLPWLSFKTNTSKSFPGDHATTALLFACSYAYLIRGKLGICALVYGAFLCLPRIAVGAHWLSDTIVGSGSIVILSLSWAFCTPFFTKGSEALYKIFRLGGSKRLS